MIRTLVQELLVDVCNLMHYGESEKAASLIPSLLALLDRVRDTEFSQWGETSTIYLQAIEGYSGCWATWIDGNLFVVGRLLHTSLSESERCAVGVKQIQGMTASDEWTFRLQKRHFPGILKDCCIYPRAGCRPEKIQSRDVRLHVDCSDDRYASALGALRAVRNYTAGRIPQYRFDKETCSVEVLGILNSDLLEFTGYSNLIAKGVRGDYGLRVKGCLIVSGDIASRSSYVGGDAVVFGKWTCFKDFGEVRVEGRALIREFHSTNPGWIGFRGSALIGNQHRLLAEATLQSIYQTLGDLLNKRMDDEKRQLIESAVDRAAYTEGCCKGQRPLPRPEVPVKSKLERLWQLLASNAGKFQVLDDSVV